MNITIDNKNRAYDIENEESTVNFLENGQEINVISVSYTHLLMINGEKLEVNADAPTMMKVINVTRNGGTSEENMNELY